LYDFTNPFDLFDIPLSIISVSKNYFMSNYFKKLFIAEIFLLSLLPYANGGTDLKVENISTILNYKIQGTNIQLEFCTPTMVRIRITDKGKFQPNENYMVDKYQWTKVKVKESEQGEYHKIETGSMVVRIYKNPVRIALYDKTDKILLNEDFEGTNGGFSRKDTSIVCTKHLQSDEHFFGFGERMDYVDRKGVDVTLNVGRGQHKDNRLGAYNIKEANYCPVPFFMSTKGYGLFFHTSYSSYWDMGSSSAQTYQFSAEGNELDYYLIYGPDFKDILDQYSELTGRSPLAPKVAFGLHIGTYSGGTWGYENINNQDYIILLARRLRNLGIPVDMIHFDSTWRIFGSIGGKGATSFEWRTPNFYNPKLLIDTLKALNFSYVGLHIRPRFDNASFYPFLNEAQKLGFTVREGNYAGEIVDFFNPKAVDWWWEKGLKPLAELGVNFTKTDEGSIYGRKANESDKVGPQGETAKANHNIFPLVYAKAPYTKFSEYFKTRGWNQTREGYAGIQKYPSIFAGDWPSEWEYFLPVMRAGINIGLSGVGYWSHCMGGFEHNADPELYMRWVQFGFFSPICHVFGMDHPGYKEPWNYGKPALANFIKYDSIRYTLFPYIYSNAWDLYKKGLPIMRSLVLYYQNDSNVYQIDDQYLFGANIMVAPVVIKGLTSRKIYLPEGNWYDFWTGKKYSGKQYIEYPCPMDVLPLLVKGGAIIPTQPEVQYLNQPVDHYTVDIYPQGNTSFSMYDDDGKTTEYRNGAYSVSEIACSEAKKKVIITITAPKGNYKVSSRNYNLKLHLESKPKSIFIHTAHGERAIPTDSFDKKAGVLYLPSVGSTDETFEVIITK
jgi:alpha-glucosidase (family GH31 glycosyl hydrolase)